MQSIEFFPGQFSPLTPALSPLRREGVASGARQILEARHRVRLASDLIGPNSSNAANGVACLRSAHRAPSPLNGERDGVRGEFASAGPIFTCQIVSSPFDD